VGAPDERWGERVVAVVQCRAGHSIDLAALQTHVRAHLADYKVPRDLVVVDAVRHLASGKPDLRWAASLCAPQTAGARS
jgi:acyl-CoA synthetase (AMP-forming)/AMP-acid ligase II